MGNTEVAEFVEEVQELLKHKSLGISSSYAQPSVQLLQKLRDVEFLQGGSDRSSVWEALDKLPPIPEPVLQLRRDSLNEALSLPPLQQPIMASYSAQKGTVIHDWTLCLSCPINATSNEQVRVTPYTEIIEIQTVKSQSMHASWWPKWGKKKEDKKEEEETVTIVKKVFYPPTDAISLKASWWGYQIFIPHDCMKVLGDSMSPFTDTLTKLTSVLAFLSSGLPAVLSGLPGVALLSSIVPIASSIIAFILWSWKTIVGLDKGNGIYLAATWILPVLIVPVTWDVTKIPTKPVDDPASLPEVKPPVVDDKDKSRKTIEITVPGTTPPTTTK